MASFGTQVVRIHRKQNGEVIQDCDVYIGRRCFMGGWRLEESPWFNPFRLQDYNHDRDKVLALYRAHIMKRPNLVKELATLKGKRLGCWCHDHNPAVLKRPKMCHGDVLMELMEELLPK